MRYTMGASVSQGALFRRAVECWEMESSLKVHASARFPLFGPLMWHTVVHYHRHLLSDDMAPAPRAVLTAWEVSGLVCVLGFLKKQMGRAASLACPESIKDPEGGVSLGECPHGQVLLHLLCCSLIAQALAA